MDINFQTVTGLNLFFSTDDKNTHNEILIKRDVLYSPIHFIKLECFICQLTGNSHLYVCLIQII